jgi:exosortase A-associated hydrolase 1/exosortase A-associated hydrolase 2
VSASARLRAERLPGFAGGARWGQWALPPQGQPERGGLLMVQPFLDEQPIGRRVLSTMASRLATEGWTVLLVDLFGTGDSPGEHGDATLAQWRDDLDRAWALLRDRTNDPAPALLGARMGALLACDLAARLTTPPRAMVLWNPPASGAALIDPLRRLARLGSASRSGGGGAAGTADGGGAADGAASLAGYPVSPDLITALRALRLDTASARPPGEPAVWLSVQGQRVVDADQAVPPALQAAAQAWQAAGWQAGATLLSQEPWWNAMQAVDSTALQDITLTTLRAAAPATPAPARAPLITAPAAADSAADAAAEAEASEHRHSAEPSALCLDGPQGPLFAALTLPASAPLARVLVVPGQPQTRVGSHRMFVTLARGLARAGIASLRVDIGGWGDSPGPARPFEAAAPDIVATARALAAQASARAAPDPIWLCGLCDGASAAVLALPALRRAGVPVAGLALINPWVRSEAGLGAAMVRGYYARRLFSADFWTRLARGQVPLRHLLRDPLRHLAAGLGLASTATRQPANTPERPAETAHQRMAETAAGRHPQTLAEVGPATIPDLPAALLTALRDCHAPLLTVLSGADLTADETEALIRGQRPWRQRLERQGRVLRVPGADHSLSDPAHWAQAIDWLGTQIAECADRPRR